MNFRFKLPRAGAAAIGGALLVGTLSGCAANESGAAATPADESATYSGELIGVGASSQGAAQEAWIAGFQVAHDQVNINYDPAGSGAGREAFQQGGAAFAGSDRAFTAEEVDEGNFQMCAPGSALVELPVYVSPIAIIFNVEGISELNLDAPTLAGIFSGKITEWNDPEITRQNPEANLPQLPITAVHRSDDSGTTGNFTDYLSQVAPEAWQAGTTETWPTEYGGEGAQGTSGVVEAVSGGVGTIGYADASRAGELGTVNLLVGETYVPYSPAAAAAAVDAAALEPGRPDTDLAIVLDRSAAAQDMYPLILVSYLIGCQTYTDEQAAELTSAYFSWVVSEAGQEAAAESAGSAPISSELRGAASTAIDQISAS